MNINLKHLDRFCIIIVALISVICGYLSVTHIISKGQQYGIEKDILSKTMKDAIMAETSLADLKSTLLETKKELNYLNERIPESGKIGLLLKQIDSLMKQRQITLIRLRPMTIREEKAYLKRYGFRFMKSMISIVHTVESKSSTRICK